MTALVERPLTHQHPDHLTPEVLDKAQRALVAKAIAEFSHERLLVPESLGEGRWRLDAGPSTYRFTARRHALEHWVVDPGSLERRREGVPAVIDAQDLVAELAPVLGVPDRLLPIYLEELASTLASSAWKRSRPRPSAEDLLGACYQEIEAAMTEGHPGFVANNGRIGFGLADYTAYAPETGAEVRLLWLGVRRSGALLVQGAGLDEETLLAGELDDDVRAAFDDRLRGLGLDPADYALLPVHPWQWTHKVAIAFAPDLARHDLVLLGEVPDGLRAQQSIRTFFNADRPERHYVKVALSIQNMGFVRGLSPAYMEATPAINDFVHALVAGDEELRARGFQVLRERAAAGYVGDAYHRVEGPSPYKKMLAALWRESPVPLLEPGERLATMAALLHRDDDGASYAAALVRASGLDPAEWVRTYLDAYLRPVVHCLLAYDLAFMPHGENLVMVLEDHVPVRMFMKDVGEEVVVMGDRVELPPAVRRIRAQVPVEMQSLSIHTDVYDGVLRHLAAILDEDGVLAGADFWALVRACLERHAADHPELADQVARHDLLRPTFRHSCLNRLQLRNTLQMVDLSDQAQSLIFAGSLDNPAGRA